MTNSIYDEELKKLLEQINEKKHLESKLSLLTNRRSGLYDRASELKAIKLSEQADVDKLEGRTLAAFFYYVVGKKDELLTKEREEAYAAAVKYDAIAMELESVEADIKYCEDQLLKYKNCESKYQYVLNRKKAEITASGNSSAEAILKLEEDITRYESQKKELNEAISAGQKAQSMADSVLSSLSDAEGWSTWDMFGGGFLTDMAKYSSLDTAQSKVEKLQDYLRRFKTELADVSISDNTNVQIDSFTQFADYFFDGLFVDWTVHDKITRSESQVKETEKKISKVVEKLKAMLKDEDAKINAAKVEIEKILLNNN